MTNIKTKKEQNTKDEFSIDFIGVGAPRCGTTWISKCFQEHPEICFATNKEVDFFNDRDHFVESFNVEDGWNKGLEWYKKQFPEPQESNKIRGEYSVSYLSDKSAAKRIYEMYPDVKLVCCFRNPFEMIYSFYNWLSNSLSTKEKMGNSLGENMIPEFLVYGEYAKGLDNFLQYFEMKNILIIFFEDIIQNPREVLSKTWNFLGVSDIEVPSTYKVVNKNIRTKNLKIQSLVKSISEKIGIDKNSKLVKILYPLYQKLNLERTTEYKKSIDLAIKEKIINYYKNDILRLQEITGRDLSNWLK